MIVMFKRELRFDVIAGLAAGVHGTCLFLCRHDQPFTVVLMFPECRFEIDRETLAVGITEGAEQGDVVIYPQIDGDTITVTGDDYRVLLFNHDELCDALEESEVLADNFREEGMDIALESLLTAGA